MLLTTLAFIAFGLMVGLVARAIIPGPQPMGPLATTLMGIAGSFLGGFVGNFLAGQPAMDVHPAGFVGSVIGAVLLLLAMMFLPRRVA